jgi:hypothetical protein
MICSGEILSLPIFFLHFVEALRMTPSLPQREKQHVGIIPLTPFSTSPVSKVNFPSTFSEEISHFFQEASTVRTEATIAAA